MDNPETIKLGYNENCTPEEGQQKKRKQKKRSDRQVERARRYREKYYGNSNTENNSCSTKLDRIGSYGSLINRYGNSAYRQPVQPLEFYIPKETPRHESSCYYYPEILPPANAITYENIIPPAQNISNEFESVNEAESPNKPNIANIDSPHNYPTQPHVRNLGINIASPTVLNKSTYYETSLMVTTEEYIHNTEKYQSSGVDTNRVARGEHFEHDPEKYVQWSEDNILLVNNNLPYGMQTTTGQMHGLNISGTRRSQPNTTDVVKAKPKKKKKRNRSAKQIERARRYRERKYGCDNTRGNALDKTNTSTETEANLVVTIGEFANNAEQYVKWSDGEIAPEDILLAANNQLLSKLTDDLDNYSAESVSDTEEITPARQTLFSEYGDHGMYGILAIYMNSGLHGHFDSTAEYVEKTSTDGSKDFGYEYFSISNL